MSDVIDITVRPEDLENQPLIREMLLAKGMKPSQRAALVKRSIDARKKTVVYRLRYQISREEDSDQLSAPKQVNVSESPEVFIAGSGPCGLFAALKLIESGLKPIVIERGKDVRSRRRDLASLNREGIVNTDSNYCFGEGGAGTYSDGKLYTRSKKRGNVEDVLTTLVAFGAPKDILIDAHPHIGTNKLPALIQNIREYIRNCGGEVRFETRLTDLEYASNKLARICLNGNEWISCQRLILATGHSARDIFEMLYRRHILIEAKPFALGVRIEHPQEIIDQIQYKCTSRGAYLPPASYSLVHQVENRGVYSFCMCPGGIIAPCATAPGEIVTNGWSPSKRNNPYANSGMVVSIPEEEFDSKKTGHPLKALHYQMSVEQETWKIASEGQVAPAQRMADFIDKRVSGSLPKSSYQPGIISAQISDCLPPAVSFRLREAMKVFGKKMRGYLTNEAVLVATESRTSSPVRIPRSETLEHPQIRGLYPAGEGAGYAGGIISAAMDGQRVAEAIAVLVKSSS